MAMTNYVIETNNVNDATHLTMFSGLLAGDDVAIMHWFDNILYYMDLVCDNSNTGEVANYRNMLQDMVEIFDRRLGQRANELPGI